jgi:hypothetical protein
LWYVLYRERAVLHTEQAYCRRLRQPFNEPDRIKKVKESMQRIRQVMGERERGVEFGKLEEQEEEAKP